MLFFLAVGKIPNASAESPVLVRDATAVSVQTYRGALPVRVVPVNPARDVAIVVLSDTLTPEDAARLRREIAASFTTPFLASHRLQLVSLSGSGADFSTPLTTAAQLQAALKRISPATSPSSRPLAVLETLGALPANLPANWAHTIVVGRLPVFGGDERWISAWLGEAYRSKRVRLDFWSLNGAAPLWAQSAAAGAMGIVVAGGFNALLPMLNDNGAYFEVTWESKPAKGAWPYAAQIRNAAGEGIASVAALSAAPATPPLEAYLTARAELAAALVTDESVVQKVLSLNPSDLDALRRAAQQLSGQNKVKELADIWRSISEIVPLDGTAWAEFAKHAYAAESFEEAAASLARASELGVKTPAVLELRARLSMRKNDLAGALAWLEEALAAAPGEQPLWLLRAECARALKLLSKETESLERAAALGDMPARWSKELIVAYLEAHEIERAIASLERSQNALPTDAAGLSEYAALWERAQRPKDAEPLWRKAIAADPKREESYLGLAANRAAARRFAEAGETADKGLALLPGSLPLLSAKEQSLEQAGDLYGARRLLVRAAGGPTSLDLLKRRAVLEDTYGGSAADSYLALLSALTAHNAPQVDVIAACRRGLISSLREERFDAAKTFADRLASAGDPAGLDLVTPRNATSNDRVEIPGGAEALEFLLLGHAHGRVDPAQTLPAVAAVLAQMSPAPGDNGAKSEWQRTADAFHEYFRRIAALNALGTRKESAVEIVLSLADKAGKQRTEKAFEILGVKLRRAKEGISVTSAEGKSQTKKQDVLAALAIDEQAIEESLGGGKSFTLRIPFDFVPVFPSQEFWRKGFFEKEKLPGGLAEALVTDIRLPRLYFAFNTMERAAAQAFAHSLPPRILAERFSAELWMFSAALALNGGAAEVPGGDGAKAVWLSLIGADPSSGIGFLQALLQKDEGRAAAFFYTLSQLDTAHQRFFTRSSGRAARFYDLFRKSAEMRKGGMGRAYESPFVQFLRELPLNEDLSVDFPGSPEVWMVAKGFKSAGGAIAKMTRKMKATAAPDDEDQILIRLAATEYKTAGRTLSELANFVVTARIDAERAEPLSPESALVLAQGYSTHPGLFPYFTRLGDLETSDYQKLLSLESKCEGVDAATANLRLGELHAFLALAGAVHESGFLPPAESLSLFRKALAGFLDAHEGAGFMSASLGYTSGLAPAGHADKTVREILLGESGPSRAKTFDEVLALQKVPSLDALLALDSGLRNVSGQAAFADMERRVSQFAVLEIPKAWRVAGQRKKSLELYDTREALKLLAKLRIAASKHKRGESAALEKLAAEVRAELEPWVELALVGRVYARYLDSSDLLVSEDSMLLRKHEFAGLGPRAAKPEWFRPAAIQITSDGEGSFFAGGLAEFSVAAGQARVGGNHIAGGGADSLAAAVFASVRATDWRGFDARMLASFGATVRLAREWIVESAADLEMRAELGVAARGILSLARRKALLQGVADRDWPAVWRSVSVSDLHFLGDELSDRAPQNLWRSPELRAMKSASQHTAEPHMLGPVAPELSGCAQPRLRRYEPYEEYQRQLLPDAISQRLAEFKLTLAWLADSAAWEPARLAALAEPAADSFLVKLKMRDAWDWSAALDAYRGLKAEDYP